MSTILNALRRLEEDASAEETNPSESFPATDPRATDELRTRILVEELAAASAQTDQHNRNLMARPLPRALAAAAVLGMAIGFGVLVAAPRFTTPDSQTTVDANGTVLSAPAPASSATPAQPSRVDQPQRITSSSPLAVADRLPSAVSAAAPSPTPNTDRQPRPSPTIVAAAVAPTQAMRQATGTPAPTSPQSPSGSPIRPSPPSPQPRQVAQPEASADPSEQTLSRTARTRVETRPPRTVDLARTAKVAAAPVPIPIESPNNTPGNTPGNTPADAPTRSFKNTPSNTRSNTPIDLARDLASDGTSGVMVDRIADPPVQQHVAPRTPDIAVLQTAWHPTPDHRSAKIRLIENDETLTLHEGDAVGPLVVQEITPSAVIFLSGEIELRLRVGRPGSAH